MDLTFEREGRDSVPATGSAAGEGFSPEWEMSIGEYLSVPLVATFEACEDAEGDWSYRGEYPEIVDCNVVCPTIVEAVSALEERRRELTQMMIDFGRRPPVPRPPLRSGAKGL